MVSEKDSEFDHRPLNYTNLEFQKHRAKTKPFPKYTYGAPRLRGYVLESPKPKRLGT